MQGDGMAECEALVRSVQRLAPDRAAARRALDGGPARDADLWRRLAELGVFAIGVPESHGGVGLGLAEAAAVAEALAMRAAPVPVSAAFLAGAVLAAGTGGTARAAASRLVEGAAIGVCLSASQGAGYGLELAAEDGDAGELSGRIADVLDGAAIDTLLVWAGGRWWCVEADAPGVSRTELVSFDPTRRLAAIEFKAVAAKAVSALDAVQIERMAWVLLGAEAVGAAQAALDMSCEYALQRTQFGQPIGRFQAIKHKLTDCLVAIEAARSALHGVLMSGQPALEMTSARMVKAIATEAGVRVTGEAVQIHGAIGNTWEHDLHLLLRRAKLCQLALGAPDAHVEASAEALLTAQKSGHKGQHGGLEGLLGSDPAAVAFAHDLNRWLDENLDAERLAALHRGAPGEKRQARRDWQARMADGGWAGVHWPAAFGGRDASFTEQVVYHATLAQRGLPPLIGNRGLSLVGPTLIVHGDPAQQAKFIEATRRADILWASGLSERGAGSDLASLSTRGVVEGDDLVITGHKIWTTSAQFADWLFALVRTGPLKPKRQGISCVAIPLDAPGLTIRPIRRMSGDEDFNELFFDEVRVSLANVIGRLGEGWGVARTTLSHEHLTNFLGQQLSQATMVQRVLRLLAQREDGGMAIDSGLRRRAAMAWMHTQILRLNGLRNLARVAKGQDPGPEGSIQKLFGQEEERRLFELALDVQGAGGLTAAKWGNAYLSTRASTIGGGTSEVHRNKIAEQVLRMPRDPWADEEQETVAS